MDPMSVIRILWRHKFVALPFVMLTIVFFAGALFFGPRAYQATSSFAMITPALPSPLEIEANQDLLVATDNPYLRSADPTLVLQVGKTRLSSDDALRELEEDGLSTDFAVGAGLSTSAQILTITSNASDPDTAVQSAKRLGQILDEQIREVQLVNGASDRYLITVQTINEATGASERLSSRLRNAAVAGIGGVVLLIGAVAVARALDERRSKKSGFPVGPSVVGTPAGPPQPPPQPFAPVQPTSQQRPPQPQRPLPPQRPTAPRSGPVRAAPARPVSAAPVRRVGPTQSSNVQPPKPASRPAQLSPSQRGKQED